MAKAVDRLCPSPALGPVYLSCASYMYIVFLFLFFVFFCFLVCHTKLESVTIMSVIGSMHACSNFNAILFAIPCTMHISCQLAIGTSISYRE